MTLWAHARVLPVTSLNRSWLCLQWTLSTQTVPTLEWSLREQSSAQWVKERTDDGTRGRLLKHRELHVRPEEGTSEGRGRSCI